MTAFVPGCPNEPPRRPRPRRPARPDERGGLRQILFTSDLSPASDRAFDHARLLAARFHAGLSLYHAVAVDGAGDIDDPPEPAREFWRRRERAARDHMAHQLGGAGSSGEIHLERTTSVGRSLLAFLRATRPDLTVMATHGRGGVAHFVLGSVTEIVLRHAASPVLCVREPAHGVALPYRRVLVPTDLSEESRRAFPLAALLARAFDAEVLAVHAVELHARSLSGLPEAIDSLVASEEAVLAFLQPEFAGLRVLPRVRLGPAWERITQTAHEDRADVVVLSTQGSQGLAGRVLGRQAERVVRLSPCPVLVA